MLTELENAHRQAQYSLRLEWGVNGAEAVAAGCDVAAVVDVPSFTNTLAVAADRGITVFPYRWRDKSASAFADERATASG